MQGLSNLGRLFAVLKVREVGDANSHPIGEFHLRVAKLSSSRPNEQTYVCRGMNCSHVETNLCVRIKQDRLSINYAFA